VTNETDRNEADESPQPDQSWTNPFTVEFERRKAELLAMPGFALKLDLEGLARAGRVLYRNASELQLHSGLFLHGGRHVYDMTDEYEDELVRFLHNYLTAVTSLIDAQRVVMRHQWGSKSDFETETYATKLAETFETGEAAFMTNLRNYCTHRAIPVPGMGTTLTGEQGRPPRFVNELTLDRDALLIWDGWNAQAKAYLRAKGPQFDLLPVIESYMTAAATFFNWFTVEINHRCSSIINEYLTAATALKEWYEQETGLTHEFRYGPPRRAPHPTVVPTTTAARAQRRRAERERRKSNRKHR
jgi:hypothetical protein